MNWFRHDAFGSHVGEWFALALAILVLFALRIALSRLVFWFKREGILAHTWRIKRTYRAEANANLEGRVQRHTVSSVTCHVTWRVMEMQWAVGFFNKKKTFCSDCEQKPAIRVG